MLHQNWFMDKRFEMFEDYGESQSFYDTETKNIYIAFEEYGQKGSTIVQEITPDSNEYGINFDRYKHWKSGWVRSERDSLKYVSINGNEYMTACLNTWQSDIPCTFDIVALFLMERNEDGIVRYTKMIDYCYGTEDVESCKKYFEDAIEKHEKEVM